MTPKEKAIELVDKFESYCEGVMEYQKECALIAVNEILGDIEDSILHPQNKEAIEYWQEVKQEIEAL